MKALIQTVSYWLIHSEPWALLLLVAIVLGVLA